MDPVSAAHIAGNALSVAKGAWELGQALYTFISDARGIDTTIQGFAGEVRALAAACQVVGNRLEPIVKERDADSTYTGQPSGEEDPLWACLEGQVSECQETIARLKALIQGLGRDYTKDRSFLDQAARQVKLNMKSKEVTEIRSRVQSHTSSLQVMLQVIAM